MKNSITLTALFVVLVTIFSPYFSLINSLNSLNNNLSLSVLSKESKPIELNLLVLFKEFNNSIKESVFLFLLLNNLILLFISDLIAS